MAISAIYLTKYQNTMITRITCTGATYQKIEVLKLWNIIAPNNYKVSDLQLLLWMRTRNKSCRSEAL
jgi:hypothetical protein